MSKNHNLKTDISIESLISDLETRLNESINEEELEEGKIKNAALAALLGLGMYAGFDATDMDNTPLAQAMEKAAEQGDEYAKRELDKLTLYIDAGATNKLETLSNKYLGSTKDRAMNETKLTEGIIDKLRHIVDNRQMDRIQFDNGETLEVDMQTANAIVSLYNAVNDTNKGKIEDNIGKKEMFQKLADFAFKNAKGGMNETEITEKDADDPCWDGYEQVGTKMKDGEEVPNCVPVNENTRNEDDDYQEYLEYRAEARATGQEVIPYDEWSGKTSARGRAEDRYNRAMQYYDPDDPAFDDFMESRLTKEEKLLAAMKNDTIAESMGISTQEARESLRDVYGYDDLAIARAQLDETTSAGSVATVSAPIGDTKKRNMSEEEMDNKDSEFDSAWFYKTVDGEVEGPYKSEKEATNAANNYADWVKQGSELEDTDRRLAKRAFLMRSRISESKTVNSLEKKYRQELSEAMGVSVNVDSKRPESKTVSVTATEEDADSLAGLLANAGLFASPGYETVKFDSPEETSSCGCGESTDMPMEDESDYSNSPDEKYQDMKYMLDVISGGINREKNSYDKAEDGDNPMAVVKEETNETKLKKGDTVKVPHKGKMVKGKIVRYDDGGTDRSRQHGGGYVVDVGGDASILVPAHDIQESNTDFVKEEDTAVGTMDEFYSYVLDFYGPNGIYDIGATEEEVKKATEIVKNEVGYEFEGDSVDRENVRDVILDQMRSEEEREEAEKAFRSREEVDPDLGKNAPDPIQTRGDVDDDMDRMRNFNETDEVKRLAGLV